MKPKITTAFILAAGFGTRLMPLTENLPKALVSYKGKPMIENVISKLKSFGITDFYINTHHHADKMEEYFSGRKGDEQVTLIHEKEILGTGGALKNAAEYLSGVENFFLYNTDIDSDIDLAELESFHLTFNSLATLCVQSRKTSRYLLCSNVDNTLIGRTENGVERSYSSDKIKHIDYTLKAFCGIHTINNGIFNYLESEENSFDIIPFYMKLIKNCQKLSTFDISESYWKDLGIPQNL